jgi:hypothetical protein
MRTTTRTKGDPTRTLAAETMRSRAMVLGVLGAAALYGYAGCVEGVTVTSDTQGPIPPGEGSSSGALFFPDAAGPSTPFQPSFGATVQAAVRPPPISGGTLVVTKDGAFAVASDPDRDALYVVDLGAKKLTHTIALHAGDEPGRLVQDGAGRVHVALRSGGAVVAIDPASGAIISRRSACPAPRGLAWDASTDLVWVACATGELVGLPSSGGASTRQVTLERDLRDVIVSNGSLSVTKFRSAEVLHVAGDGSVSRRDQLPSPVSTFAPHVAWRVIAGPSGSVVAVHQAETTQSLSTTIQGGYGGGGGGPCGGFGGFGGSSSGGAIVSPMFAPPPLAVDDAGAVATEDAAPPVVDAGSQSCFVGVEGLVTGGGSSGGVDPGLPFPPPGCGPESGAVLGVLTILAADGTVTVNTQFNGVLPVDVAVSSDGSLIAAVAPGNAFTSTLSTLFEFTPCGVPVPRNQTGVSLNQPIAIAFNSANDLIVQTREPTELVILSQSEPGATSIPLSTTSLADTGFDVFHTQAGGLIACASCHPEGRDDGHVWTLDGNRRRTPSLRGTIAGTAPYHWPGDEPNLDVLVNDVYTVRMSGATLAPGQMDALTSWVESVPAPPAPTWVDSSAAKRGKTIFNRVDVGCITCHSGAKFTNNQTVDVGTGGKFQVPPLVGVGWRTPLLHDGCAATIADRFGACSSPQHGSITGLSTGDISDLSTYLETL